MKLAICAAKMQKLLTFNMFNWAGRDGPTSALCTLFLAYLAKVWAFTGPKIRDTYLNSIICRFGANVLCHRMLETQSAKRFWHFPLRFTRKQLDVYTYNRVTNKDKELKEEIFSKSESRILSHMNHGSLIWWWWTKTGLGSLAPFVLPVKSRIKLSAVGQSRIKLTAVSQNGQPPLRRWSDLVNE